MIHYKKLRTNELSDCGKKYSLNKKEAYLYNLSIP